MVTHGRMPIPNPNMGAIENIVWNYQQYLQKDGHTVDIYNSPWIQDTIYNLNNKNYDFIHVHFELFVLELNAYLKKRYMLTCHSGALAKFIPGKYDFYPGFNYSFSDILKAPGNFALSEHIKELYLNNGYTNFLRVLGNPVEVEKFRFNKHGNGKAVCIGRIQPRKQQVILAKLLENKIDIDFIGPNDREWEFGEQDFKDNKTSKYLGSFSRDELYNKLSDYSCLVHFSNSEVAAPLVVLEAMSAGLSIVTTKPASDNLTTEKFISIVSEEERDGERLSNIVQEAIDNNLNFREEIRSYAFERFDYSKVVKEYIQIAKDFSEYSKNK